MKGGGDARPCNTKEPCVYFLKGKCTRGTQCRLRYIQHFNRNTSTGGEIWQPKGPDLFQLWSAHLTRDCKKEKKNFICKCPCGLHAFLQPPKMLGEEASDNEYFIHSEFGVKTPGCLKFCFAGAQPEFLFFPEKSHFFFAL